MFINYSSRGPTHAVLDLMSGKFYSEFPEFMTFEGWHPNGNSFLVRMFGGLALLDVKRKDILPIAMYQIEKSGTGSISGAAFSPDGTTVVYSVESPTDSGIWLVGSDGKAARKFLDIGGTANAFAWSPDGRQIAFSWNGYWVVHADGSNLRKISELAPKEGGISFVAPRWSPDGKYLLAESDKKGSSEGSQLFLLYVDQGTERLLQDQSIGYLYPVWSPDGRQIALLAKENDNLEIWTIDLEGKTL